METEDSTESMRHVPPAAELLRRVDEIYRKRMEAALAIYETASEDQRKTLAPRLIAVARWLERVPESPKENRGGHRGEPNDPPTRTRAALQTAVEALHRIDTGRFGHRSPFHRFEQSGAERLYEAVLAAGYTLSILLDEMQKIDSDVWWRLLDDSARDQIPMVS